MTAVEVDEPEADERGGVVRYFRDNPGRIFGWLGVLIFIGGWGAAFYNAFHMNSGGFSQPHIPFAEKFFLAFQYGAGISVAPAILWAIGAYITIQLLPEPPEESIEAP